MTVRIDQLTGTNRRGETVLHDLDRVLWIDSQHPAGMLLGYVARTTNATFQAVANAIPEAVMVDILAALHQRDFRTVMGLPEEERPKAKEILKRKRKVEIPPTVVEELEDEDDE